jgi:hypothetical protein
MASVTVATNGITSKKNKLGLGIKKKLSANATIKNANEPVNVFCSCPNEYFPLGNLLPK